ncbi:GNAT family N-acetyltransferase [Kytococcus sedentarius]|uniref:GNAT family N-acetyltransferase n=1 Tax=Kytococcus sedentarius TaxID=1276 RepID=UPI00194FDC63|nr:GNAT family N-acetyltransferase [Kytococcus sedentarius]QRO87419.1 GNAT family N-acetyltransferase [Kytococcus sedentarius]
MPAPDAHLPPGHRIDEARPSDLPDLLALLRDDHLGATREVDDPAPYDAAFARIDADPAHFLAVLRDPRGRPVGTMHLVLLPGLARAGATRLQVEAVRIAQEVRSGGLGAAMIAWAHAWGAERGATIAQLTSDASREAAHRFYARLGYAASHVGMKRPLP